MYISAITNFSTDHKTNSLSNTKNINSQIKSNNISSVHFQGYQPDENVLKNKYRILLTQDIWAEKLDIKIPDSELEKNILLEILNQRKNLDRYTRLQNEKAKIMGDLFKYNYLAQNGIQTPEREKLFQSLAKRGNLATAMSTLDKNIALEKSKNREAIEYFKNIEKIENEYLDLHKIKSNELAKFYIQVRKNNINKEHQYSTQELINIISNKDFSEINPVKSTLENTSIPQGKKQILLNAQNQYEKFLREKVNIYIMEKHWQIANEGRRSIFEENKKYIEKYPGLEKQLNNTFDTIQKKYSFKTQNLGSVNVYKLGEIWLEMNKGVVELRETTQKINTIKTKLKHNKNDKKLLKALEKEEKELQHTKKLWIKALRVSMDLERKNREKFVKVGKADVYDYLTSENKEIQCYKNLEKISKADKWNLPEEIWAKIIQG